MAGPLGVSHLLLFSRSTTGNTNLRLALTPRGPTLHFRVSKYSLCKDIRKLIKHPRGGGHEHLTAPLLVMNNFATSPQFNGANSAIPKHLESLVTTVFQSLFPPISPLSTPLSSIRRVLLLDREIHKPSGTSSPEQDESYIINLRHYAILTKRTGLSRGVRRLHAAESKVKEGRNGRNLPNLGKLEDIADYLLDPAATGGEFTSGSESELETDAEVEVLDINARKVLNKTRFEITRSKEFKGSQGERIGVNRRAVKLVELGPRMRLRLSKIEEDVCGGKVLWHEYLSKSKEESKEMEKAWELRRREKEERKQIQRENVERKRKRQDPERYIDGEQKEEMDGEEWDMEESDQYPEIENKAKDVADI